MQKVALLLAAITAVTSLSSCAPGYKALNGTPAEASTIIDLDSIQVTYSLQPWGENRFRKKAAEQNMIALSLLIENNTSDTLTYDNRKTSILQTNAKRSALDAPVASQSLKYGSAGYWFWSLLWLTIGTEDSVYPIPIGVLIGATQASKAKGTNNKMTEDFSQSELSFTKIPPGDSRHGLVYFLGVDSAPWTLEFELDSDNGETIDVSTRFSNEMESAVKFQNGRRY